MGSISCKPSKKAIIPLNPHRVIIFDTVSKFSEYYKETLEYEYTDKLSANNEYVTICGTKYVVVKNTTIVLHNLQVLVARLEAFLLFQRKYRRICQICLELRL